MNSEISLVTGLPVTKEEATPEQLAASPEPDNTEELVRQAKTVHAALDIAIVSRMVHYAPADPEGGVWTGELANSAAELLDLDGDGSAAYYRGLLTGAMLVLANVMLGGEFHDDDEAAETAEVV